MGKLYDRVKVTTATTGTGTITLGGGVRSASEGDYLSFAEAGVANGETVSYFIIDGNNWAKGEGVYTSSGTTLTRDANEKSWNGTTYATANLNLSGNAKVFISPRAADLGSSGVLIETQTVSGAVPGVNLTLPGNYPRYEIEFTNVKISVDGGELGFRTSSNGGSSFDAGASDYAWQIVRGNISAPTAPIGQGAAASSRMNLAGSVGNDTNETGASGKITIINPSQAQYLSVLWEVTYIDNAGNLNVAMASGRRLAATAVNAVRIYSQDGGDITAGAFTLTAKRK